ncbi:site-specific DNA-methyltransferase [Bacillus cereus]|nr:site-specific DNA-methyltransferase [Bacillus cereus AH1134]PEQ60098.1 site-specific DNA-methyltransferase [Bacillus cereus]PFS88029.1 site-specific DNA-methyltransferase [Bacillus cereus]
MGRDDVLPNRMDRIRSVVNAVLPQQIYPIFAAIAKIERRN